MKKRLLSLACVLLTILGFASSANALNTYAYGLRGSLSEDGSKIIVSYSLNAPATEASIVFMNGAEAVKTIAIEATALTAGSHNVEIPTTDLPKATALKWFIEAKSATVATPTEFSKGYRFYHPQGVVVDNSPNSDNFGRVLVTECMEVVNATYHSGTAGDGQGLYAFDPALAPIKNDKGGYAFKGGVEFQKIFPNGKQAYDSRKVRISDDGRIFLTRQASTGTPLLEVDAKDLNAPFVSIIQGTIDETSYETRDAEGAFIAAPNVGFDVSGKGDDLKVVMLSANASGTALAYSGFRTDEYNLGSAKTWNTVPSKNIEVLSGKHTINYSGTSVQYDNEGGIWYVQYRATPKDTEPAILHVNAAGVEDYRDIKTIAQASGVCFNNDFSLLAIANKKASVGIYEVGKDADQKPTLTLKYEFATNIGSACNDIAWDHANNLYIVGNSGEWLKVFALPRANEAVITPAMDKYIINIPETEKPLYMIGQIKDNNYTWGANVGLKMTMIEEGIYTASVRIATSETVEGIPAFGFATKLGANADDWSTLNANRYGTTVDGTMVENDKETALVKAEGAFKIAGWTYDVTVDMNKMTVKCVANPPIPAPEPTVPELKRVWKITEGLPAVNEARQMTVVKGNIYIQNKLNKTIEVWNKEGKTKEIQNSGSGTNICRDQAGNIIVRVNAFPGIYAAAGDVVRVFPADGSASVDVTLKGLPAARSDVFGEAQGNILDADNGGKMYFTATGIKTVTVVPIIGGVQDQDFTVSYPLTAITPDGLTTVQAISENEAVITRRETGQTAPISKLVFDFASETMDDSFAYITPNRYSVSGSHVFTMGGVDYIIYKTSGSKAYKDGFAIAKATNDASNAIIVEHAEESTSVANSFQANWVIAEVVSDTKANIYQYYPGGYISMYEFTVPAPAPVDYPEQLYAIGALQGSSWDPSNGSIVLEKGLVEGTYVGSITPVDGGDTTKPNMGFFALGAELGADSNDWNTFNAHRYGPVVTNTELKEGEKSEIGLNGDTSYALKVLDTGSYYKIEVDLKAGIVGVTMISGVDQVEKAVCKVVAGVGEINVFGDATTIEVFNANGSLIESGKSNIQCASGIYFVRVDGKTHKVIVR